MIAVLALPWEEKKEVEKVVEREMRRVERRTRRQGARAGPESKLMMNLVFLKMFS